MNIDPNNFIAKRLPRDELERYRTLIGMSDQDFRQHLITRASPFAASAMALYLLDRVEGYRRALDQVTGGPRSNGTDTSDAAAKSIDVSGLKATVLCRVGMFRDGATSDMIEERLDLAHQTVSARFNELRNGRYLCQDGKAPTRSGRLAWLHKPTDDGWRRIRELADLPEYEAVAAAALRNQPAPPGSTSCA